MGNIPILLKWPGGKRLLVNQIIPFVPESFDCYYEPFLGGGALFFALQPANALLGDNNPELINCYTQVRDHPDQVISYLSILRNSKDDYYRIRDCPPEDDIGKAARMIYLMTLSFNGIYRVNTLGKFNVPYNNKLETQICDPEKIHAVSASLAASQIVLGDFKSTVSSARKGDFIYFDPPYTVAHKNNGFVKYNAQIFSWDDQIRLATLAKDLSCRGCHVLISNADHPSIEILYKDFKMHKIMRTSSMAASTQYRQPVTEYLFYNGEG